MFTLLLITACSFKTLHVAQTHDTLPPVTNTVLIKTKEDLIKFSEPKLFQTYGKDKILREKPYIISFKNGIWTMKGTLPAGYAGGTFLIIVSARDGTIRKLTHFK